jgi:hypothetical protein
MPSRGATARTRTVLIVALPSAEREGLFSGLAARGDLQLLRVGTAAEASRELGGREVSLLIAAPEIPAAAVTELVAAKERLRPGLPVLVIRDRQAEEPTGWERHGVGVLRRPLLPEALDRSVDVVLGLRVP